MNNDTKAFLGVVAVMVVLTAVVVLLQDRTPEDSQSTMTYNGFTFTRELGLWTTQWQRDGQVYNVRLNYNPNEVEDIPVIGSVSSNFTRSGCSGFNL